MPPVNRYTVAFMNDDGNAYPQLSDFPSPEAREQFENTFLFLGWTSSLRGLFQCLHWRPESLFKLPNRREGEHLPLRESLFRYNTVHLFQLPLLLYMLCPNSWSSAPSSIYRTRSLQSRILKERVTFVNGVRGVKNELLPRPVSSDRRCTHWHSLPLYSGFPIRRNINASVRGQPTLCHSTAQRSCIRLLGLF